MTRSTDSPRYREVLQHFGMSEATADKVTRAWPVPSALWEASPDQLRRHGVTAAQLRRLRGAVDLARLASERASRRELGCPFDAVALLRPMMEFEEQEGFRVVSLDVKLRVLDVRLVALGSLTSVEVHPREVFREAVRLPAASVILAHNHPSGDPTPSDTDESLTCRLIDAGRLLGIQVLDHVVIAHGGDWWSFHAHSQMPRGYALSGY